MPVCALDSLHSLAEAEGGHRPDLGLLGGLFETGTRAGEGASGGARVLPVGGLVGGLFLGLCVACVWPVFGLCLACVWRLYPPKTGRLLRHGPVSGHPSQAETRMHNHRHDELRYFVKA